MGCEDKYYKPEEAATILKMKPENIWRAIRDESNNPLLPAVNFIEPVSMKEQVNYEGQIYCEKIDRDLSGLFNIYGAFDDARWAESHGDYLDITFTTVKPPELMGPCYLRRNGKQYSVPERRLIPKVDLVITKESIERFAKSIRLTPACPTVKKRQSNRADVVKPAYNKFQEAFNSVISQGKKPTIRNILSELKTMAFDDDELFVSTKGSTSAHTFEYCEIKIEYSTFKHWFTALKK